MAENMENKDLNVAEDAKKKSKKKPKVWLIVLIVVVAILMIVGVVSLVKNVSASMEEAMEMMAEQSDVLYEVEKVDVKQEITTSGTVIGLEQIAYTSPVTAKVKEIPVEAGQIVKKGDVLIVYDSTDLGDNLAKVQLQAQSEKAAGNEAYATASKAAEKAKESKANVKDLKKDIKELKKEIEDISDELETYQEQLTEAEANNALEKEKAAIPQEDGSTYSPKLTDTTELKAKVKELTKSLNKKNEKLAEKQAELAQEEGIVTANEDVEVSASTKAQISASNQLSDMNVNEAQEQVDAAIAGIVAENDGIVLSVDIVEGSYASETQTLITMINADEIGVEFSISKDDLTAVTEGQKARVVIADKEYTGKVEFVSRVATLDANALGTTTSGGSIKGRIVLDNPDENIFVGVSAKAYIFIGESAGALAVPYSALCTDVEGDYVLVVNDNNIIERKDITLGLYSGEYYEVLEGLAEGDKVITEVTKDMKPGEEYVPPVAATGMTMY